MSAFTVLFLVVCVISVNASKTTLKPASYYFNICHRSDPDIDTCIKNSIEQARPQLVKGIPELGLVPLDPLHVPRMEFKEGDKNFKFRQVLYNVVIRGLSQFSIERIKTDIGNMYMEIQMRTPYMNMTADYEMDGQILVLPLSGRGDCVYNFTNVLTIAYIQGKRVTKDGAEYMEVDKLRWKIDASHAKSHFNNLFNGDKILGDMTNRALNENWREAFESYKYLPEDAFGLLFKDLSNKVYRLYPFEQLFPE